MYSLHSLQLYLVITTFAYVPLQNFSEYPLNIMDLDDFLRISFQRQCMDYLSGIQIIVCISLVYAFYNCTGHTLLMQFYILLMMLSNNLVSHLEQNQNYSYYIPCLPFKTIRLLKDTRTFYQRLFTKNRILTCPTYQPQ